MSLPKTMKAFKCLGEKQSGVVETPLPAMRPDYILVKVSHVALNPTDWKHIDGIPTEGATVGCDFSGTVLEVGPQVRKPFKPGDRVAAFTHGVNKVQPEDGAFGEYAVAKGDVQMLAPDNLTDEQAATFGVAVATVGQGMYQRMGLPLPSDPAKDKPYFLVNGGSTATGFAALQFARQSGCIPVATCSPRNDEIVKSYGAEETFDYKDPDACAAKIREYTKDGLMYAFDCISQGDSAKICAGALSSKAGAKYCSLLPLKIPRDDVNSTYVLAYTVVGERFIFRGGKEYAASPEDHEYAAQFMLLADRLLAEGKIRPPPIDFRQGGLDGIKEGLEDLKAGRVSGKKVVYKV